MLAAGIDLVNTVIVQLLLHLSLLEPIKLIRLRMLELATEPFVDLRLDLLDWHSVHRLHNEDHLAEADGLLQSADQIMVFPLEVAQLSPQLALVCYQLVDLHLEFLEVCLFEFPVSLVKFVLFFVHHVLPLLKCLGRVVVFAFL